MGVTAELCDKIVATNFESLTPEAVTKARRLVLDGIAVAVAGSREEAIAFVGAYRRGWRATPRAIAWLRKVLQISVLPQLPAQAPQWRELQPRLAKLPLAGDEV